VVRDIVDLIDLVLVAGPMCCLGWNTDEKIRIDYRFAAGDPALFKTYAAELVGLSPDAILASTPPAVQALRQQMPEIPIVFVLVPSIRKDAPAATWLGPGRSSDVIIPQRLRRDGASATHQGSAAL
jgi:hypothetical protein